MSSVRRGWASVAVPTPAHQYVVDVAAVERVGDVVADLLELLGALGMMTRAPRLPAARVCEPGQRSRSGSRPTTRGARSTTDWARSSGARPLTSSEASATAR